jgi:hypothetical protein
VDRGLISGVPVPLNAAIIGSEPSCRYLDFHARAYNLLDALIVIGQHFATFHTDLYFNPVCLRRCYTFRLIVATELSRRRPPNHPDGTIHKTKAEAEAAELVEHH